MKHGYAVLNEKAFGYFTNEEETQMIVLSSEDEDYKFKWPVVHITKSHTVRGAVKQDFDNFKIYYPGEK